MYLFMYSCTHCNKTITGYIRVDSMYIHMYDNGKKKGSIILNILPKSKKKKKKERINKGKSVPIKIDKGVLALT